MKTKQALLCGLIAAALALFLTACLTAPGGARAHTHQWGEWAQVSGDDASEERACKADSAHRQTRLTGTDRFGFRVIGETTYRVWRGTLTTGERTIPAYYRPDADSEYLPVTEIESRAFSDCTSLTSLTLPAGVTSIGIWAFSHCESLIHINIPASVTSIDSTAFYGCTSLTRITVDRNNPHYASESGILYNKAKTELIAFPSANGNVTIPAGVTTISYGAFNGCASLTSITFPASIMSIEGVGVDDFLFNKGAFAGCDSLISVTFAEGSRLETISNSTFQGCTSLTVITIPASVTSIGEEAFRGCASLTSITIPATVTSIGREAFYNTAWFNSQPDGLVYAGKVLYTYKGTMPDNTVINNIRDDTIAIADGAFAGRDLTSITLPSGVTSIGNGAFYWWTASQTINLQGKANQAAADTAWGVDWRNGCDATINYLGK